MKSVILNEEQVKNPCIIAEQLFNNEKDPRSISYKRKLNRPLINWKRILLFAFTPILLIFGLFFLLKALGFSVAVALLVSFIVLAIYSFFIIKRAVICCIKIYQRYAPDKVRNKCRFEPSCSEYMIIVIRKFGLIKGINKGIDRLKRCNINGGGFDYPE